MNNSMDLQREAIIDIVGTQYEGRVANHQYLMFQQNLILKHQRDNAFDNNAVVILNNDGKELGLLPKGYASLYAPALDCGRYSFTVEIVKSEPDPERPILIVKITSELINRSEKEIENDILNLLHYIVSDYAQRKTAYQNFIYSETVSVDELLLALNNVRLLHKLNSCSHSIISFDTNQSFDNCNPLTMDSLPKYLSDLKSDVSDVLKKIQKEYNESLDIDDEDDYYRVQSEIRERRKKFRLYEKLLSSYLEILEGYVIISDNMQIPSKQVQNNDLTPVSEQTNSVPEPVQMEKTKFENESPKQKSQQLTEQGFFDWLVSRGGVSDTTAKQYISNIHSIEKLYQTLYGVRKNILESTSTNDVKTMIEVLIQRTEYNDANERRHNSFSASLKKFAQFAEISINGITDSSDKKSYQPPTSSESFVIMTVDFNNPDNCTNYKPCSLTMNESKYSVESWREVYTKFLKLLYNDNKYSEILKGLSGKSVYGRRIDFADKGLSHYLRRPIKVSNNLFAEGNLSAIDIIKRIKYIMGICSIDNEHLIIEYTAQEKDKETVLPDDSNVISNQCSENFQSEQDATSGHIRDNSSADHLVSRVPANSDERISKDSFIEWLTSVQGLTSNTARMYYNAVKEAEQIAREYKLKSQNLLMAQSYLEASKTFNEILQCDHFVRLNKSKQRNYTAGIQKFLLFYKSVENRNTYETIKTEKVVSDPDEKCIPNSFTPDTTTPFVLKDAVIEILSSDTSEIGKYREHKGGISTKNLRELLKDYYGKEISLFEISKLLMIDKAFQSVGKGCYALSEEIIPTIAKQECSKTDLQKNEEDVGAETENINKTIISSEPDDKFSKVNILIEEILDVIKDNSDNLQYQDGFGVYEVKNLLAQKGITDVFEEQIEALMSECSELKQVEDGYYSLIAEESSKVVIPETNSVAENVAKTETKSLNTVVSDHNRQESKTGNTDEGNITLWINGNSVKAYDYSDALNKLCEFSINCKPFKMARITGQAMQIHGNNIFYRTAAPIKGYNKLSNGLQIIKIDSLTDLQSITTMVKNYCQIDEDMITIICQ